LVSLFTDVPESEGFKKFIEWLNPRGYFQCGGGDCDLRGHLETLEKQGCMILYHPHGILSQGMNWAGAWSPQFKKHAGSDTTFFIDKNLRTRNPFFKILCGLNGHTESMNAKNIDKYLSARKNVGYVPGGFADATVMKFGCERAVGSTKLLSVSIRYGLKYGYKIYPLYTFGECDTYHTMTGLTKLRLWVNSWGMVALMFFGDLFFPLFPRRNARIHSYVGLPVQLPRIEQPTVEDVAHWKAQYLKALHDTFNEFKEDAGYSDRELEILDVQKEFGVNL